MAVSGSEGDSESGRGGKEVVVRIVRVGGSVGVVTVVVDAVVVVLVF